MKKWEISYKLATKDMYEGREPWEEIRINGDDYVEAESAEEAIELYRDYMKDCADNFDDGDDDEILFLDDDDEILEVAMHFVAVEVEHE